MLKVGDKAPEFSLPDQEGNTVSLESFRGQKVLLWFYPKASTPGCTAEGCNLRDNFTELQERNVAVLGMSKDSVKRQKNFGCKEGYFKKIGLFVIPMETLMRILLIFQKIVAH